MSENKGGFGQSQSQQGQQIEGQDKQTGQDQLAQGQDKQFVQGQQPGQEDQQFAKGQDQQTGQAQQFAQDQQQGQGEQASQGDQSAFFGEGGKPRQDELNEKVGGEKGEWAEKDKTTDPTGGSGTSGGRY